MARRDHTVGSQPTKGNVMRKSVKVLGIGVGVVVAIAVITSLSSNKQPATTVSAPAPTTATSTVSSNRPVSSQAPPAAAPAGPDTQFTMGSFIVGTDVKSGTYKTAGPGSSDPLSMCYWSRSKDSSGDLGSIIANEIVQGPSVVTVNKGEVLKTSGACTWKLTS